MSRLRCLLEHSLLNLVLMQSVIQVRFMPEICVSLGELARVHTLPRVNTQSLSHRHTH